MNDSAFEKLREEQWRRKLTETEEAELRTYFAEHPGAQEEWDNDAELSQLLDHLPQAPPVSSNFTALVLQAVERDSAAAARASRRPMLQIFYRWLPRAAVASLVIGLGVIGYERHEMNVRTEMARNAARITEIVSVSSNPELLQDFEAIRRLSDPEPKADVELLALY